ncbi:hypothetical protein MUK42_35212 [Musa troglodytarum]|uniref:Uncharacterized protein n=1 Tax=Musa troglodytarum TaxID=320322 RepID=A0A9E7HS45_9LILI|nr:hypothetical protein MUK42_17021 [Musa troglodytarum]URE30064.1 hypothetical protein MUK42_17021 [Musa troglodytarum]URE39626.1 hypothetical protein MUK42_35212 [Musa troglodytarum]URE39627.1 hypothetical protein MUK42_35212 [Musa troglodytarum]
MKKQSCNNAEREERSKLEENEQKNPSYASDLSPRICLICGERCHLATKIKSNRSGKGRRSAGICTSLGGRPSTGIR